MNIRTKRKLLWSTAGLLVLACISTLTWAFLPPHCPDENGKRARVARKRSARNSESPTLATFKPLWNLKLQRQIYDPPPAQIVKRQAPPLAAKLTGAAVDPDDKSQSLAFFNVRGKTVMSGIGEKVGIAPNMATILEISENYVMVKYDNKTIKLKTPE